MPEEKESTFVVIKLTYQDQSTLSYAYFLEPLDPSVILQNNEG